MVVGSSSLENEAMAGQLMIGKDKRKLPLYGIRKILIRGTNWIGDAVLTLSAISAIRNTYPDARVFILVKPWVADIFRICPLVDEVIDYKSPGVHEGISGMLRLAKELRNQEFDMVILLQNAIEAAIIAWLSGIPVRAGYNTDARGFLLSHSVPMTEAIKSVHQSMYYLTMVQSLGCGAPASGPFFKLTEEDEEKATRFFLDHGIDTDDIVIGMAPGATYGPAKKWFPDRFGALAEQFGDQYGATTILFGSTGDCETTKIVQQNSKYPVIDLAGKTDLRTAVALMARCRLFISNDSGLMHVAGALRIPTIAIFGSTNPITTAPIGENNTIIYRQVSCSPCLQETCHTDFGCMESISIEAVYTVAKGLIKK